MPRSVLHVRTASGETRTSRMLKDRVANAVKRTCMLRMAAAPGLHMSPDAHDRQFRRMFDANFDTIHAYCLRRLSPDDAGDAVSEIFLVAWRRIDSIPAAPNDRLWLFGVARNVVRNAGRSTRRSMRAVVRLGGLAPIAPPDPPSQVVTASEHGEIMVASGRLSSADQEILKLRLWEELSVAEPATVLDCSEKAASKRYQRAITRLDLTATRSSRPIRIGPHAATEGGEK